jgi:signal peptidase II
MGRLWIAGIIALILDQISKWILLVQYKLDEVGVIEAFPPYLVFRMGWNDGINFGLFGGGPDSTRWILVGITIVVCGFLIVWAKRKFARPIEFISAGLIIGGAIGNLVDRLIYGAVVDFLNMSCCGIQNPYTFNLADIFIFAGALGLLIFVREEHTP